MSNISLGRLVAVLVLCVGVPGLGQTATVTLFDTGFGSWTEAEILNGNIFTNWNWSSPGSLNISSGPACIWWAGSTHVILVGGPAMTFSPPVAGPVIDFDVAFDVGCGQACWPATLLPVVRQGSVNYVWNGTPVNVWTATAAGTIVGQVLFPMLLPSQFDDALGSHPDPSCNAGPWRFGFRAASGYSNPTGCGAYPAYWIDNFSVTMRFTSSGCNPAYAGTGEDLLLTTGVNGPANGILIKTATTNDYVHLGMASPGGAFVYAPAYLVAQAVFTGANPASPPGLPFIHVDPGLVTILYGGTTPIPLILPPSGVSASGQVPAGLGGVSILFQGAVITPLAANGVVASTSLHEIQIL